MNTRYALLLAALAALPTTATEEAMKQALSAWDARVAEYQAALTQAPTEEAKAAIEAPDGTDVAPSLWQAVCGVTATRQEEVKGRKGDKQLRTLRSYEFEQPWAAPAVARLLSHPAALAAAIGSDKPKQVAAFTEALKKALRDTHYNSPAAAEVCHQLSAGTSVDEYDTLEKIYTRNQDNNARACAAMGMSLMLSNPMVSGVAGSEAMARAKRIYYLKQALLLAKDETTFGGAPLTEVAKEQAYRLRFLSPGCVPPQLTVRDLQGKEHTFPETGKANLLFFWSPQESVGSNLIARMAQVQKQYPDLVICPICPAASEEDKAAIREAAGEIPVYTDNEKGSAGQDYRISVVPTAVLLGANSTILYIGYPDMKLQTALETAMRPSPEQKQGTIIIKDGTEDEAPVVQPGSTPKTDEEQPPTLRDMPEFK
ncbi:MAG: hypothetical protein MJ051_00420 [Akkermansia sp.]|nr:hypothetical protein [Akkermansia sp.]